MVGELRSVHAGAVCAHVTFGAFVASGMATFGDSEHLHGFGGI